MKGHFSPKALLAATTFAALLPGLTALAQVPGSAPSGVNATLSKLFGDIKAFTAKADVQVLDNSREETMRTPMNFVLLNDKIRVDIDLSRLKSKQMTPEMGQQLKQMGMELVSTIVLPDKKEMYTLFPAMQACLVSPLPKDEVEAIEKPPKVERSELGKETIDGHACVKTKVVMTDSKGLKRDALTWNATDLKNFPLRIQTAEKDSTLIMNFSQVQFTKPETKQFEVPAGFTKYNDMQELTMGMMKKMMNGDSGK